MALRPDQHEHKHIRVTDELLSAYLDNEVSPEERAIVEQAIAHDPKVALRLRALQQTVALLSELPRAPLPRAFTLSEADIAPFSKRPFWHRWQGSLLVFSLRGATVVAATLLVVLLVSDVWWARQMVTPSRRSTATLGAPNVALPVEKPPSEVTMIAQAPTTTPLTREPIATEVASEVPFTAEATIPEVTPTRITAQELAQEPSTPKSISPEVTVTTAEAPSPVVEALAIPIEVTPTPEEATQKEEQIGLTESPPAPGMLEPPAMESLAPMQGGGGEGGGVPPGVFSLRGPLAPVAPGAGGEAGGEEASGLVQAPAISPPAPREVPFEESQEAVAKLAVTSTSTLTPTPAPTLSPTATSTPTPTFTPTVTPAPALSTPTPASLAMVKGETSASESSVSELSAGWRGPFGLSRIQMRVLELVLGALVVILGAASWLVRPR